MDEMSMSGEVNGVYYTASYKDGRIMVFNHCSVDSRDYYTMSVPGTTEEFLLFDPESPDSWFRTIIQIVRDREAD